MEIKTFGLDDYNQYWKKRREKNRTGISEIHKIIISIINEYVVVGGKILDLGVGPGHVFKELQKKYQCYGMEISDEAFNLYDFPAHNIKKADFSRGISNFDGVGSFDAIIASNVVHHLAEPLKLIREIKTKMNKNSIFILVTPNVSFFLHRLKYFFKGEFPDFSFSHRNFITPREFKKIFDEEGFKIDEIKTMGRHKTLLKLSPFLFSGALFFVCRVK
ncbi:class I SAM-dependent methyltransferase [Candidatus Falkowbacteria bacterium]|nr:class I SAM-dependent methyltransferase [Candidatus Falkowbacteria bacterium]